jgi:surface polysaccharide O-acyltransferase-like enzyme
VPVSSLVIILAMVGYAIYRQSQRHEVVGSSRFKLAIIYGIVGIAIGGYHVPTNGLAWLFLAISVALSVVVGLARGRYTRVWPENGSVYAQGTALTIGLFLGLVVAKFALGTVAYFAGISDNGGIGEVLIMIAVMVAFQAELVWRRAQPLGARTSTSTGAHAAA